MRWSELRQAVQDSLPEEAVVQAGEPRVCMHFADFLVWSHKTTLLDFMLVSALAPSRSQAIKLARQNGLRLNGKPLAGPSELDRAFTLSDLVLWQNADSEEWGLTLSRGKTVQHRWVIQIDNTLLTTESQEEAA